MKPQVMANVCPSSNIAPGGLQTKRTPDYPRRIRSLQKPYELVAKA